MTAVITRASDYTYRAIKHFETLNDLIAFMEDQGSLILSKNHAACIQNPVAEVEITIYDDYIE